MKCAACQRYIQKPSALTDGGLPMGPVCARKNGLSGKKRAAKSGRKLSAQLFAEQAGQLPLFEGMTA